MVQRSKFPIRPVKVLIVGAGSRAMQYAAYSRMHPEEMQVVGVVEPDLVRRNFAAQLYSLKEEYCFETVEQLKALPKLADAAINGTMDAHHVMTSLPLLELGYDLLLEKPIGISEEEVLELQKSAQKHGRSVVICHVLRFAPFYSEIRKRLEEGEIGSILHITMEENVSYHHMATSFIRGKWGNEQVCGSPMLLAKCCHDLDILTWMMGEASPAKVSSFGGLTYFRPERAPEGAGKRCLTDCAIEADCPYSARRLYVERGLWKGSVWNGYITGNRMTEAEKLETLATDSPFGRCVWHSDNDVADHQTVNVEFDNHATASFNLTGGTAKPCRTIHILGTKGELYGVMEEGSFVIRKPTLSGGEDCTEETVKLNVSGEMHGGGDLRLVADFVRVVRGEAPTLSTTSLDRSIMSHQLVFAAERSRHAGTVERIEQTESKFAAL